MRLDDRLTGLLLALFGIAVFLVARTFPAMAGMPYGPGFFPSIAAIGLIVCGILIAVTGAVRRVAASEGPSEARLGGRGAVYRPLFLIGLVVFFGLALPHLGFHITATITVGAAALVFGGHPFAAPVLALTAAFGAHALFYSLLRVPLPWGILTPVAW